LARERKQRALQKESLRKRKGFPIKVKAEKAPQTSNVWLLETTGYENGADFAYIAKLVFSIKETKTLGSREGQQTLQTKNLKGRIFTQTPRGKTSQAFSVI